MPKRPNRPCSHPSCPKLTDGRFCTEHEKQEAVRYEKYDRDPSTRRRYGRAWKRIRDRYIAAHPLCAQCEAEGKPEHSCKPEGIATEMVDCLIRILDWCGKEGVDVEAVLAQKHEYNRTRPYRHGGKAL